MGAEDAKRNERKNVMSIKIETQPVLTGAAESQLRQVYAYLYRLSEHLNVALQSVGGTAAAATAHTAPAVNHDAAKTYHELRALVVNTAEVIRSELDAVESALHAEYEAVSGQWGSFRESIDTSVTETAREVVRSYAYDSAIETLRQQAAGFDAYRLKTEGCIRQGFIEYAADGTPVLGIAIGQGLKGSTVTIDGREYEQFDGGQSCAFYTAEKVSFRINGQEVAYVSNRKLYIGDMEVTGAVMLNSWLLTTANGFTVKWIGGASA